MQKANVFKTGLPNVWVLCIGASITIITMLILSIISAICIVNEYFAINTIPYIAILIQFLGTFLGTVFAGKNINSQKVMACAVTGGTCYILQLCFAMLFYNGISRDFWIGFMATSAGIICAILLSTKEKKRSDSKRKRKIYR